MSVEHVREIILKAFDDQEFKDLLFSDLEKAIAGYDLTDVEIENLKGLNSDLFDEALPMEERISRAGSFN